MTTSDAPAPRPRAVTPWRRVAQAAVLAVLVALPLLTRNPMDFPPSRIVLGQLPEPRVFFAVGDTWAFHAGGFTLLHPLAFVEALLAARRLYLPLVTAVLLPLALTLVLGRVFCSWLCPVGFLLELNRRTHEAFGRVGLAFGLRLPDCRYPFLGLGLALSLLFAVPVLSLIDPPHVLGRELMLAITHGAVSLSGASLLLGIFVLETLAASRALCRHLCPSGGALALLGSKRPLRIRLEEPRCTRCEACDDACPYELAPMKLAEGHRFDWTTCDNCGLCRDACPEGVISFRLGAARSEPCP